MKQTKTVFRIFTIFAYRKEEEFLSHMHEQGWKLRDITFPGFYHFEECEPDKAVYRLDYNHDSDQDRDAYLKLFEDCG